VAMGHLRQPCRLACESRTFYHMGPLGGAFGRRSLFRSVCVEVFRTAVALMVRSMVLSAQSAGQQRLLWLQLRIPTKVIA